MMVYPRNFTYAARAASGEPVQGRIDADSVDAVLEHLTSRGLTAVEIRPAHAVTQWFSTNGGGSRKSAVMLFLRSFAILLGVGISLRRALLISIEETSHAGLREALASVLSGVESGLSLTQALRTRGDFFKPMTIALVEAGERSGTLVETLERHAALFERGDALRRKLIATLTYPAIVLFTALTLVIVLMVSILPTFADLFTQLRVDPPWTMRLLLRLATVLSPQNLLLEITPLATVAVAGALLLRRSQAAAGMLERLQLHLPIIGSLLKKAANARIARALATLLAAGISVNEALTIALPIAGLRCFRIALQMVLAHLRDGGLIAEGLRTSRTFDGMLLHLVAIGEETGTLDAQLLRAAEYCERAFEEEATRAAAFVEPLLIAGIGGIVGFVVFSVFVPLYSLVGNIK